MEYHAHFAAQGDALFFVHGQEVAPVVEHFSPVGGQQADNGLHEHRLARTALADDEVGLAVFKDGADVFEHGTAFERLIDGFEFNHFVNSWVKNRSENRIRMLLLTTASVLALPTAMEPPSTV